MSSNIYWPRRPDLCNQGERVCEKLPEHEYRLTLNGVQVGVMWITGDHVLRWRIPGLTLDEVERDETP